MTLYQFMNVLLMKTIVKIFLHILCVVAFFVTFPLVILQVFWAAITFCFGYDGIPNPIPYAVVDYLNERIDRI